MPNTSTQTTGMLHPKDAEHGDRVTVRDSKGNELTGLLRRRVADNKLEISLTMSAFGKEIRVATWKAGTGVRGNGKWNSYFPIISRELTLW
jgi:hypothetical protein